MTTKTKAPQATQEKSLSANLGFKSKLWLAAYKLRDTMESGDY